MSDRGDCFVDPVGRMENLRPCACDPIDHLQQLSPKLLIEAVANLVQDQDARSAGQSAGDENLSQFTRGKGLDIPRD